MSSFNGLLLICLSVSNRLQVIQGSVCDCTCSSNEGKFKVLGGDPLVRNRTAPKSGEMTLEPRYLRGPHDEGEYLRRNQNWGDSCRWPDVNKGCQGGYCWTYCKSVAYNTWCYTTRAGSQSYEYVPCSSEFDCCPHWKCASSCFW